jgi:hypothetical protein
MSDKIILADSGTVIQIMPVSSFIKNNSAISYVSILAKHTIEDNAYIPAQSIDIMFKSTVHSQGSLDDLISALIDVKVQHLNAIEGPTDSSTIKIGDYEIKL